MTQGRQGADEIENPLTKRVLGASSKELVPCDSAGIAFAEAYVANLTWLDRGQTGVDE